MPEVVAFHYVGIIQELSEALRAILNASDWLEASSTAAREHSPEQRQQSEKGNLAAAISRMKNAYTAADARFTDLALVVTMREHAAMMEAAPHIAQAVNDADTEHLPVDLRVEP